MELQIEEGVEAHGGRKPWRVDAKWIFGILFVVAFAPTFFVYGMFQVTDETSAGSIVGSVLERTFLLDEMVDVYYEEVVEVALANPEGDIGRALGLDLDVGVVGADIAGFDKGQVQNKVRTELFHKVYRGDLGEYRLFVFDLYEDEPSSVISSDSLVVGAIDVFGWFFSERSHEIFKMALIVGGIVSFVLGVFFFLFSYRFGKMVGLGAVFLVTSIFPVLVFYLLRVGIDRGLNQVGLIDKDVLIQMLSVFESSYFWLFIIGLALFLGGIIIGGIYRGIKGGQ